MLLLINQKNIKLFTLSYLGKEKNVELPVLSVSEDTVQMLLSYYINNNSEFINLLTIL
jgi:hypothetical protein